jgi:TrmH family RNA methyltransferase
MDSVGANQLSARFRAARDDARLAVLEGFHPVKHALRFGAELLEVVAVDPGEVRVLVAELAPDVGRRLEPRVQVVDAETFAELVPAPPPTRVVALARRPADELARLVAAPGPGPIVLLDSPRHLGNVGAAIRVAAAAGAEALAVTGSADPWHPAAIRGGAGLQFALPVGRVRSAREVARPIVALDPEGEPLRPEAIPSGAALAFGSERAGLSPDVARAATLRVALPMRPGVSSLNLATAVAATLYGLRMSSD